MDKEGGERKKKAREDLPRNEAVRKSKTLVELNQASLRSLASSNLPSS
jgi:hypothetical protein